MDRAVMDASPEQISADLTLAAEAAASTRANIMLRATCAARDAGARVPVSLSAEVLGVARDAVRRGADTMLVSAYHAGQNVAWRFCMQLAFALGSGSAALPEALDLAARSIFTFVDDMVAALTEQMEREREQLTRSTYAERFEVANLILEGAPIAIERASARLGYDLGVRHLAAIVWGEAGAANQADLDAAAEALARAAGARRPLTVIASTTSLWVWW